MSTQEARELIVNADDFGRCKSINSGILQGHDEGIVTSTSMMVRWPDAVEAAKAAVRRPDLSVGLHIDLAEWSFVNGEWKLNYSVTELADRDRISERLDDQLQRFIQLLNQTPTHLDSHQHIHLDEVVGPVVNELAARLDVPLRKVTPSMSYCGDFYGQTNTGEPYHQAITSHHLIEIIKSLKPGVTELGCHPGHGTQSGDVYNKERQLELNSLCDPKVRETIVSEGVLLRPQRQCSNSLT